MSVDSSGTVPVPVQLAAAVDAARAVLGTLTGLASPPSFDVVTDVVYDQGSVVDPGRPVSRAEQESVVHGGAGAGRFDYELTLPGSDLRVWVMLSQFGEFDPDDPYTHPSFDCVPPRHAVGMAISISMALAAATLGQGLFSSQLPLVNDQVVDLIDPAGFIASTLLTPGDLPLREACVRYMEQFPRARPGDSW